MRTLPLTVLASEGAQVRAYLVRLRRAGLRPARIVLMVPSRRPGGGRPRAGWLPRGLRLALAQRNEANRQRHWPLRLRALQATAFERTQRAMRERCEGADEVLDAIVGGFRYEAFADDVRKVLVSGLRDPALPALLAAPDGAKTAVLFTGGGIVPASLLATRGLRLIHVHPGHLPDVRGADGLLWSVLLGGRPGMSCFYMAQGIDTGDLVAAEDLPPLEIPLPDGARPGDDALYQLVFAFVDPLLRAEFLVRRVLTDAADPTALPCRSQDPMRGETFHFMHPDLRKIALSRLFPSEAS